MDTIAGYLSGYVAVLFASVVLEITSSH